jgi:hypothetical protein
MFKDPRADTPTSPLEGDWSVDGRHRQGELGGLLLTAGAGLQVERDRLPPLSGRAGWPGRVRVGRRALQRGAVSPVPGF